MYPEFQYTDLIYSLAETVDLINPIVANHHKLVAYISYSSGKQLGLSTYKQIELEIAGSLHDIGGLTLSERLAPTEVVYKDTDMHAKKGYLLLNNFKPLSNVAKIVRYHHHSWLDGECKGINNECIPFESNILNLADRIAVLVNKDTENILNSVDEIVNKVKKYEGSVFAPQIIQSFVALSKKDCFWLEMKYHKVPNFIDKKYNYYHDNVNDSSEDFIILVCRIIDLKVVLLLHTLQP